MSLQPLMKLRGSGLRIGIVTARFNATICEKLLAGAKKALAEMGVETCRHNTDTQAGATKFHKGLERHFVFFFVIYCSS